MRRAIAAALAAGVVALPATMATAAHVPTKAQQDEVEAVLARVLHGTPHGTQHMASDIDAKYFAVSWSQFVPDEGRQIPSVGMAYMKKYGDRWGVYAYSGQAQRRRADNCRMIPRTVRAELATSLKVKDVCEK